jgi:hypothetical protein
LLFFGLRGNSCTKSNQFSSVFTPIAFGKAAHVRQWPVPILMMKIPTEWPDIAWLHPPRWNSGISG